MVTARYSADEHAQVRDLADRAGVSMSEYLRSRSLDRPVPLRRRPKPAPLVVPELNRLAYQGLDRVGNNLNQIARAIHRGGAPEIGDVRRAVLEVGAEVKHARFLLLGDRR
jgi:hypothetical protein